MEFLSKLPLFGSIANALMIICGALVGLLLRKHLPKKLLELPVQGLALYIIALGLAMAIKSQHPLVVVASIALGSVIGELLDIESWMKKLGDSMERHFGDSAQGFSVAFVTTSLLYCTGSMAVLGSFEEGLGGYPTTLLTKGLIDGFVSVAMAASLGFGAIFSSISVLVYQGVLTIAARWMQPFMSAAAVTEMTATGGLMLMAIGLGLLKLMKIRVMNMLPGLVIAVVLVQLFL
jgi:uncharacterized membrane protein YqgA involved in biofilm formation